MKQRGTKDARKQSKIALERNEKRTERGDTGKKEFSQKPAVWFKFWRRNRRKKEERTQKETANYRCFRQDSKDFQILALVFMFAVNTECRLHCTLILAPLKLLTCLVVFERWPTKQTQAHATKKKTTKQRGSFKGPQVVQQHSSLILFFFFLSLNQKGWLFLPLLSKENNAESHAGQEIFSEEHEAGVEVSKARGL